MPAAAYPVLGVIKLGGACGVMAPPVLKTGLLGIAGVAQVRIDSPRRTVHILYDGAERTAKRVVRFVAAAGCSGAETRFAGIGQFPNVPSSISRSQ